MHEHRENASLGAVAIGKIALLHRQEVKLVFRQRADLAQLADQEIGQWLWRRRFLRFGWRLRGRGRAIVTPMLDPEQVIHGLELGLETL